LSTLCRLAGLAAVVAVLLAVPSVASANPSEVYMNDACSPSFNDVVGPGTCTSPGGMPFDVFASLLTQNKFAGAWQFSAPQVHIDAGSSLTVENRGGETHSFTQATQFGGGGIVAPINQLIFGTPTPPTFFFGPFNFVPSGGETTIGPSTLTPGTHLFICVIHPWMHETVVVG
jgi:plastocyanin